MCRRLAVICLLSKGAFGEISSLTQLDRHTVRVLLLPLHRGLLICPCWRHSASCCKGYRRLLTLPFVESLLLLLGELPEYLVDGAELLEDRRCLLAVARGVISRIHRVYDTKLHLVVLRHWQRVERLVVYSINSELAWVERVAVEVKEAHEQARGRQARALLQLITVHISHN